MDFARWEPEYTRDPYFYLAALRAERATHKVILDGLSVWLVTRYDEARAGMNNPGLSTDPRHASPQARSVPWVGASQSGVARNMVRTHPPEHTRLRRLIGKAFTPRRIERLRPRIAQVSEELLARFVQRGSADLLAEFASPLPLTVIAEMLGVAEPDHAGFLRWVNLYAGIDQGDAGQVPTALGHLHDYLVDLVARALERPDAGDRAVEEDGTLLDGLVRARDEEGRLSAEELIAMTFLILVAGYETTVNLIANGALLLMRSPDQLAALRADPDLLRPAIEEFLRYESPVKINPAVRYATADVLIGDTLIPAGDPVLFHLGSANRDAARFPEPDRFDITRRDSGHLAFGQGLHHCLGAPLARLEAEIAFPALLAACPDLRLAVAPESLRWRTSRAVRALRELPVRFTPGPLPG
jgi:cytochrome P450